VNDVRTDPLTPEEISGYRERGFLFPIRVLDGAQVEEARQALDDHLEGRRESKAYELTDPIIESDLGTATVGSGVASAIELRESQRSTWARSRPTSKQSLVR